MFETTNQFEYDLTYLTMVWEMMCFVHELRTELDLLTRFTKNNGVRLPADMDAYGW